MSSSRDDNEVNYGIIKPTAEQIIYTLIIVLTVLIMALPPVHNTMLMGYCASQWIIITVSTTLPVIAVVRALRKRSKQ